MSVDLHSLALYGAGQAQICSNPHVRGDLQLCTGMGLQALAMGLCRPGVVLHAMYLH